MSTTENIGKKYKILGVVRGNTIRARWFGRDIAAGFKMLVGERSRAIQRGVIK